MSNFHSSNQRKTFFEGWYFKHQKDNQIIVLIPGINIKNDGRKYAFIQIISNENSYCTHYKVSDCIFSKDKLFIKIGENIFCKKGIKVNIETKDISLKGTLRYGELTPIRYPIMGLFRIFPRMECNHEIISMNHRVQGNLIQNGNNLNFENGIGYMEKDWGRSFPKTYYWLQCNSFMADKCSIIVSIAEIPFLGFDFKGCICVIHYKGIEYRLATYLGVNIVTCNKKEICLRQGRYLLNIQLSIKTQTISKTEQAYTKSGGFSHKLLAPNCGEMSRNIQEQHYCFARYKLHEGNRVVFDLISEEASLEIVE